jgi:hypothetical protein
LLFGRKSWGHGDGIVLFSILYGSGKPHPIPVQYHHLYSTTSGGEPGIIQVHEKIDDSPGVDIRGLSGRKKSGQGTPPDGGAVLGCRKADFWFPLARKKLGIHFSTPEAGLSGQKPIKRTQKRVVLGVFGHFPQISKRPRAKNIIDAAFSFEDRSGATMFLEHADFQAPGLQSWTLV